MSEDVKPPIKDLIAEIPEQDVRNRLDMAISQFNFDKVKSAKDLITLYGHVFELLAYDIITPKKSDAFAKLLSGAATCKKDFLSVEFPDEILKQCNETMERWKAGIISALQHLLSEDDFGKVMKEVGKTLGWSSTT